MARGGIARSGARSSFRSAPGAAEPPQKEPQEHKVIALSRTTTTDATGTSTTTTFALVPGEKVEMQEQVGHKVEVTGVLIPAGRVKSETKTSVDREHGKDVTTREKTESDAPMPQFKVTSIKSLADRCD